MKNKIRIAAIALLAAVGAQAQTLTILTNLPAAVAVITGGQVLNGTPVQFQGQTFLVSTNASGGLQVETFGIAGTNVMTAPANPNDAMNVAVAWLGKNNPANIGFYGTNEINARIGILYLQNSGKAAASEPAVSEPIRL